MSSLTPHLGIKKPDGTDSFSHTDFDTNFDLLDTAPGAFICTSGSHPPVGTLPSQWWDNQVGRLIMETDTGNVLYFRADHTFALVVATDVDAGGGGGGSVVQAGIFAATFSAATRVSGGPYAFATPFGTVPSVVAVVQVGSDFDLIVNTQNVTTTGFTWTVFTRTIGDASSPPITTVAHVHWIATLVTQ